MSTEPLHPPRSFLFILTLLVVAIVAVTILLARQPRPAPVEQPTASSTVLALEPPSKTTDCHVGGGLPDRGCTPGAVDPHITQENIQNTICQSGYTKTVRPPTSYTDPLKRRLMAAYGFQDDPGNYELDHLVPLELGGAPRDPANLWPEPGHDPYNFHGKDTVENALHDQVCRGAIALAEAQREIATDWVAVYHRLGY